MSSTTKQTLDLKPFQRSKNDCGSPEVQIATLTHKINELTTHCKENRGDKSAVQGMIARVNRRKKLLKYLYNTEYERFDAIVKTLGIRRRIAQ